MKLTREVVTVLPDPATDEVTVVLAGWRITLTLDEASVLAVGLLSSLERLRGAPKIAAEARREAAEAAVPAGRDEIARLFAGPLTPEAEALQQRTRSLIQATIREKGLSLREEERA
jgi:hypothetical protein